MEIIKFFVLCMFAYRLQKDLLFVEMHVSVCFVSLTSMCVSPGGLEEACSRMPRQHWGSRPPATHQTASGWLLPAVFQHGGELCVRACTLSTESPELNSSTWSCMYSYYVIMQRRPKSFNPNHSDWSFQWTLHVWKLKEVWLCGLNMYRIHLHVNVCICNYT